MELFSRKRRPEPAAAGAPKGERAPQPRVPASEVPVETEVRLSPGGPADLINLSESGALVETRSRLAVDAKVTLSIGGAKPQRLAGRVVRCQVCAIHRDNTMSYQLGIAFEQAAVIPGELPQAAAGDAQGTAPPSPSAELEPGAVLDRDAEPPIPGVERAASAPVVSAAGASPSTPEAPELHAGSAVVERLTTDGEFLLDPSVLVSSDMPGADPEAELVNEW